MILTRLEIDGFRSLVDVGFDPHPSLNLLSGPNGSGKSSVLEAVQCLSTGHSFRSRKPRELVSRDREHFTLTARLHDTRAGRDHRVGLSRHRDGELEMRLDYEAVDSAASVTRLLPVKALSPDSHALLQEGPDERRRFLDWGVFHVEPRFLNAWRVFRRSLSQRNQALRDQRPESEVITWDEQLAGAGTRVDEYRRAYVEELAAALDGRVERLESSFPVELRYRGGWTEETTLVDALRRNLDQHRRMRTTTDGPHRAELVVSTDGVPARQVLSRGQQKVLVYLMHLAQLDLIATRERSPAVVLCDDLLSELDAANARDIIDQLLQASGQMFVTGVSLVALEEYEHCAFHVERGTLSPSDVCGTSTASSPVESEHAVESPDPGG